MDFPPHSVYLHPIDYAILCTMLSVSVIIGTCFAFFFKQKQNTTSMFLLGRKKLGVFPVATSMAITQMAGATVPGLATEMYMHGTQFWIFSINQALSNIVMVLVYFPVFRNLNLTSIFEYFNRRFNHPVRLLASGLSLIRTLSIVPICIYVPALVLAQVSGLSLNIGIPVISSVAIVHTTLGGMTAVVWVDAINMVFSIVSLLGIAIVGTSQAGGISVVWEKNKESGRIEFFNMDLDPRIRHTFWNILIGRFFAQLSTYSAQQSLQQRLLSLPSLHKARIAVPIFVTYIITLSGLCCYIGLVMSAEFSGCDPVTAKIVSRPDQILPYYVMKTIGQIPAFPGIFICSICSLAIGATAVSLNAISAVITVDFIKPLLKRQISEKRAAYHTKIIVVISGIIVTALAYIIDKLGLILQIQSSLSGMTDGTMLGLFTLGILFPWANSTGAMVAGVISLSFVGWVSIGAQEAIYKKQIVFPTKPLSIDDCDNGTLSSYYKYLNVTEKVEKQIPGDPFPLFTVSYIYYTLLGVVITVTVGLIISFMTHPNNRKNMDPNLFSPIIHKFLNVEKDSGTEMKLMENKVSNFIIAADNEEKCKAKLLNAIIPVNEYNNKDGV